MCFPIFCKPLSITEGVWTIIHGSPAHTASLTWSPVEGIPWVVFAGSGHMCLYAALVSEVGPPCQPHHWHMRLWWCHVGSVPVCHTQQGSGNVAAVPTFHILYKLVSSRSRNPWSTEQDWASPLTHLGAAEAIARLVELLPTCTRPWVLATSWHKSSMVTQSWTPNIQVDAGGSEYSIPTCRRIRSLRIFLATEAISRPAGPHETLRYFFKV